MPQCCVDTILIIVDNTFSLNYKGQCKHFAQNNKKKKVCYMVNCAVITYIFNI